MKQSKIIASALVLAAVIGIGFLSADVLHSSLYKARFDTDTVKPKTGGAPSPVVPNPKAGAMAVHADTAKKPQANAVITVNEDVHEFGKIEQNTFAETTFILGNKGTDTLEVFSAQPSC